MTSTVQWVGSPKSRQKEQNQLICDSDRGEGVKKSEIFADVIYGSPLSAVPAPAGREGEGARARAVRAFVIKSRESLS